MNIPLTVVITKDRPMFTDVAIFAPRLRLVAESITPDIVPPASGKYDASAEVVARALSATPPSVMILPVEPEKVATLPDTHVPELLTMLSAVRELLGPDMMLTLVRELPLRLIDPIIIPPVSNNAPDIDEICTPESLIIRPLVESNIAIFKSVDEFEDDVTRWSTEL